VGGGWVGGGCSNLLYMLQLLAQASDQTGSLLVGLLVIRYIYWEHYRTHARI